MVYCLDLDQYEACTIRYRDDLNDINNLQTVIMKSFDLDHIPELQVRWVRESAFDNDWPPASIIDQQNLGAVLNLIAARGSRDTIRITGAWIPRFVG